MRIDESYDAAVVSWIRNTTLDPNNVQVQKFSWYCPANETNWRTFMCETVTPCSIPQWKEFCKDQLQMAHYVQPDMILYWIIAQIIIGLMITMDMYNHAVLMRHVSPFHKWLLMMQIFVASIVARLNAQLTARSDTAIDILMNAAGLYILNEFDNVVLMLFLPCRKK